MRRFFALSFTDRFHEGPDEPSSSRRAIHSSARASIGAYAGNLAVRFALGYPFVILMSMMTAAVTFIIVESPFLQLRGHLLQKRRNTAPAAQVKHPAAG